MSNTPTTNNHQEEIDLGYLIKKINRLFIKTVKLLFGLIAFLTKYKFAFLTLLIISIAYGIYTDSKSKTLYDNQAIVIPNFESVDYLYDKVEALNAKIRGKDSLYLKQIVGSNYASLRVIEIEPIMDIYNFGAESRENIDILRILFQNQDFDEFVDHIANSKNYKYHRINFKILGSQDSNKILSDIVNYLNENSHFNNYQSIFKEHYQYELNELEKMIGHIDSVFESAKLIASHNATGQSVFINDNSQLNNLIYAKRVLINSIVKLKLKIEDQDDIIKIVKADFNLLPEKRFSINNKVKYPIFIFLIFSFYFFSRKLYYKLSSIAKRN